MNFETVLFAVAFLLLAVLSLPRNETPPANQTVIERNSEPPGIVEAAPVDEAALSMERDTEIDITIDGSSETPAD